MNGRPRALGVITARGGSKRVPRKNVLDLGGKPLISWTFEAALQSQRLDRVILTTDNEEIADLGRSHGIDVPFMRPAHLATDTSGHRGVMIHAARAMREEFGDTATVIVCLQPTTPFRQAHHIDEAIDTFLASGADSLISIREQDYPPWWMFEIEGDRLRAAFEHNPKTNVFNLSRKVFPTVYRPNGAIYVTWIDSLLRNDQLVNPDDCAYYMMEDRYSVNIDSEIDFATAFGLVARGSIA